MRLKKLRETGSNGDDRRRRASAIVVSALTLLTLFVPARASAPYTLDVQDRVRVFVAEWPALNVEVAVGSNGSVALPLVGEIAARGREPAELALSLIHI